MANPEGPKPDTKVLLAQSFERTQLFRRLDADGKQTLVDSLATLVSAFRDRFPDPRVGRYTNLDQMRRTARTNPEAMQVLHECLSAVTELGLAKGMRPDLIGSTVATRTSQALIAAAQGYTSMDAFNNKLAEHHATYGSEPSSEPVLEGRTHVTNPVAPENTGSQTMHRSYR